MSLISFVIKIIQVRQGNYKMVDRLEFRFPGVETGCSNNVSNKKDLKDNGSKGWVKHFPKE